ncbi:hypothetical protein SDC9_159266 [bioreactor metagenome]|uniref:Uncharacterized protein n=1 Tax=bioreactor metagenome TaxID=1076179 RepID=A0A645FCF3_9ZZZZ
MDYRIQPKLCRIRSGKVDFSLAVSSGNPADSRFQYGGLKRSAGIHGFDAHGFDADWRFAGVHGRWYQNDHLYGGYDVGCRRDQ